MPAEQIARNLAFVNWTVLAGLAVGAFATVVLLRLRTDATKGYLGFTALCAAAFGGLAWLSDGALPIITGAGSPITVDSTWDLLRRSLLALLALGSLAYAIALFRGARAPILGIGSLAAGLGALAAGALTWGGGAVGAVPLAVQLVALAGATGGAFAGMILGHWYLVTPKISTGPALALTRGLLWVVALQVTLFAAWVGFGAGQNLAPFAPLTGPWALFVWLRLLIGLVFPLVVTWAAGQTVKTRSMESATGLLYIDVGAIAAGTILAAGLYFGAGLLV
ncbi:MAG TPA: hypothetical protein VIK16_01505 [Candidatus Limnocylindrales bacterium]